MAVVTAILVFSFLPKWTVDDAYISYRYGVNLVETGQLVWNPGEPPVEGYTGIVLPLLAAFFYQMGISIPAAMQVLGSIAWCAALILFWFSLGQFGVNKVIKAAGVLVLAFTPILYTHALSGLETMLFVAFLMALAFFNILIIKSPKPSISSEIGFAFLALITCLTRPEGLAVTLLLATSVLVTRIFILKGAYLKLILILLIFWILPYAGYLLWKINYYGDWLPNTWYAKRFQGPFNYQPLMEMGQALLSTLGPMILLVIGLRLFTKPSKSSNPLERAQILFSTALFALPVVFVLGYLKSELFMNYSHRFFAPLIPLFLLGLAIRSQGIFEKILNVINEKALIKKQLYIYLSFFTLMQLILFIYKIRGEFYFTNYYKHIVEEEFVPVANTLKQNLPHGAKVAIYMDAGVVPFKSGFTCIDFGKLNDHYLAHGSRDPQFVADYFFSQAPEAAVFNSFSVEKYEYIPEAHFIQADPRFEKYRLFRKFSNSIGFPYYQFIYLRTTN